VIGDWFKTPLEKNTTSRQPLATKPVKLTMIDERMLSFASPI